MQYRFFFKNTKNSNEIKNYSEEKLNKICFRYSQNIQKIIITLEQEGINYKVHCSVIGGKPFNFELTAKTQDIQSSVDVMLHKLQNMMYRSKDKLVHRHHCRTKKYHDLKLFINEIYQDEIYDDWENIAIDAEDILKFEKAKGKKIA